MTSAGSDLLVPYASLKCKHCASPDIVKHGRTVTMKQRYHCRACGRTFLDNTAPPGMRFQADVIASTLNSFYEGASLGHARRYLQLEYGVRPDHSSIHRWIMRYTKLAALSVEGAIPEVGHEWVALSSDPPATVARGQANEILDIVDMTTGFLIATRLSFQRTGRSAQGLLEYGARKVGRWPDRVLTNSPEFQSTNSAGPSRIYQSPKIYSTDVWFESPPKMVNRVRAWLRSRSSVLAQLTSSRTAQLVFIGWAIHYNYFRAHSALNGDTPADRAGITAPFKNWADVVANGAKPYADEPARK